MDYYYHELEVAVFSSSKGLLELSLKMIASECLKTQSGALQCSHMFESWLQTDLFKEAPDDSAGVLLSLHEWKETVEVWTC